MKLGKIRKAGVGLVAAAALAGGTAVAGAGIAAADAPDLNVSQEANNGQTDVTVETTDSNGGLTSFCVPILASGETGLQALIDYNNGDYGALFTTLTDGDNVHVGKVASDSALLNLLGVDNPSTSTFTVDNGVYFLIGVCANPDAGDIVTVAQAVLGGDFSGLAGLVADDVTVQPVIVPSGIGSISPALQFGSTASSALPAIVSIVSGGGSSDLLGGLSD